MINTNANTEHLDIKDDLIEKIMLELTKLSNEEKLEVLGKYFSKYSEAL